MWQGARVALIVPAFREARLIGRMLQRVPNYVDGIFVVDDASDDGTREAALACGDERLRVIRHARNRGVGAAIVSGYRAALGTGHDVLVVMAGDDQMHPDDLPRLLEPIVAARADYVKGNRFVHADARRMPVLRRLGGEVLSLATRLATGLAVGDCQCGYTALSARCAERLPLEELWPRFGYPNDLLALLASAGARVVEAPVRPVYADEGSGVRAWHVPRILALIVRRYLREAAKARQRAQQPRALPAFREERSDSLNA